MTFIFNMSHSAASKPTVIPPAYPTLVDEVYEQLLGFGERTTEVPPPSTQVGLELVCAGLEVEW